MRGTFLGRTRHGDARHESELEFDTLAVYCETVTMKNITVSISEEVHRRARVKAAEEDTSLSAVVREYLYKYAGGETERERRKRLERETLASIDGFRADDRLPRDELYSRSGGAIH